MFSTTSVLSMGMTKRFLAATTVNCAAVRPESPTRGDFSVSGGAVAGGVERAVFELAIGADGAQHQAASRHVAEAGEGGGEAKTMLENGPEDVDVLAVGNAAQATQLGTGPERVRRRARLAIERLTIIAFGHVDRRARHHP